jgi:hypothetical protein
METSLVRKRLRQAMDAAKRDAGARRGRIDAASRAYEVFLEQTAVPAFRAIAMALRAENLPFEVTTPSGAVRLVSDRSREDAIHLELDGTADPPHPLVSVTRGHGSRMIRTEHPLKPDTPIDQISDEDVVEMLLQQLRPWLG